MRYNDGFIVGTGAARNIELGFVPSSVKIINISGRATFEATLAQVIAFDSGSVEIKAGMRIDAADEGWRGVVAEVILASGSWAGGDAAGWIVFEPGTLVGSANIANNDGIFASDQADLAGRTNVADVSAAGLVAVGVERPVGGGAVVANAEITPYLGTEGSAAKGFTIAAGIAADNDLVRYQAWAPDPGSGDIDMSKG